MKPSSTIGLRDVLELESVALKRLGRRSVYIHKFSVMKNFVFQVGKLLDDLLTLGQCFGVFLLGVCLKHIVDCLCLAGVSACLTLGQGQETNENHGPSSSDRVAGEGRAVRGHRLGWWRVSRVRSRTDGRCEY